MTLTGNPTFFAAFLAGVLSFVSPCCLPLYPSYLSYISGVSVTDLKTPTAEMRRRVLSHSFAFLGGFALFFLALGLSTSLLGQIFSEYGTVLRIVGGLVVIVMGLATMGVLKVGIFQREMRYQMTRKPSGYLGSLLVGVAYSAGWTPCVGPILAGVIGMAATQPGSSVFLLLTYAVGFSLPFLALSFALGAARKLQRYSLWLERVGGGIMVLMGVLLITNGMTLITRYLINLYGGWLGF